MGAERASLFMRHPFMLVLLTMLVVLLLISLPGAWRRKRFDSLLLHAGCALVLSGWLAGEIAPDIASEKHPRKGYIVLDEGERTNRLYDGAERQKVIGHLPFALELEKFTISYYGAERSMRAMNLQAPVREYRSRVMVLEPGKEPYARDIRVNYPLRVRGYYLSQMSWGVTPLPPHHHTLHTVLLARRDPGWCWVLAGFALLTLGIAMFTLRVFGMKAAIAGEEGPWR